MRLDFGKYYVENEGINWTIFERKVRQEGANVGEEYGSPQGYYTRLEGAMNGLLNLQLQDSHALTAKELQNDLRAAVDLITTVVRAYGDLGTAPIKAKVASIAKAPVAAPDTYHLPKQALTLLPGTEYELLELRRKGRGHTAVVKLHSPERVRNILEELLAGKSLETGQYVAANRALALLQP